MKKKINSFLLVLAFLFNSLISFSQEKQSGIGEVMRSNGRIYVVLGVMLIILLGIILYLVRLEKKINRLEKEQKQ